MPWAMATTASCVAAGLLAFLGPLIAHASLVFVAQQGGEQRIADQDHLAAGKHALQDLDTPVLRQPQLHAAILVLARHPLHEQVRARATADDGIRGTDDRFLRHLNRNLHAARHPRPQMSARVLHGDDDALRPGLPIHLQPQVVDLAAKGLARQRREARLDWLAPTCRNRTSDSSTSPTIQSCRRIDDVIEMVRGADQLADANIGMT